MPKKIKTVLSLALIISMLVSMIYFPVSISLASEEKVVFVDGIAGNDTNDGSSAELAVKTFGRAVSLLEGKGGTIVISGEVVINGNPYYLPEQSGKLIITSVFGGVDYGATNSARLTLGSTGKCVFQAQSEVEFNNITINNGHTACAELWSGPSLTIGENVTATDQGGPMGNDLYNGDIAFRCGYYNRYCESASLNINSGIWSYIQGGNNRNSVGSTTINVGGMAELLMNIQCSGTNKNVGSTTLNVNGIKVPTIYVNGYGSANIGTCNITIDGGDVYNIYGTRVDATPTGHITDAITLTLKKDSMKEISINLQNYEGHVKSACVSNLIIDEITPETCSDVDFSEWKNVTISGNSELYLISKYAAPSQTMNIESGSSLILTDDDSMEGITWEGGGSIQLGELPPSYHNGNRWNMTQMNMMLRRGAQGMSIFGDHMFVMSHSGSCIVYDLTALKEIGSFNLASFNDGSEDGNAYANHANQAVFSGTFYDDNTIPLIYVTDGNSGGVYPEGWKDPRLVGSYIGHCSVENIFSDGEGNYTPELVQKIYFNDYEWTEEDYEDLSLEKGFDVESPGWGWFAWFPDSDNGYLYIFSARYRTNGSYDHLKDQNRYIITKFELPEVSEENDVVILTPEDILEQFTTYYDVDVTQGGTLHNGLIYYTYGFGNSARPSAMRVFDLNRKEIISTIDLSNSIVGGDELESCAIWEKDDGSVVLILVTAGRKVCMFDLIETKWLIVKEPTINEDGLESTFNCLTWTPVLTRVIPPVN